MKKLLLVLMLPIILSGCQTYNAQMYGVSADTNQAIKSLKLNESVYVGEFSVANVFDTNCRAVGPITLPNNLSYQAYIKKAFEDELKIAGAYAFKDPKVSISGRVNRINMSSSKGLTRGYWDIDLTLTSSNGKSVTMSEYYEFESGFDGFSACKNTADALMPTVQNLVGKIIKSQEFKEMVSIRK